MTIRLLPLILIFMLFRISKRILQVLSILKIYGHDCIVTLQDMIRIFIYLSYVYLWDLHQIFEVTWDSFLNFMVTVISILLDSVLLSLEFGVFMVQLRLLAINFWAFCLYLSDFRITNYFVTLRSGLQDWLRSNCLLWSLWLFLSNIIIYIASSGLQVRFGSHSFLISLWLFLSYFRIVF